VSKALKKHYVRYSTRGQYAFMHIDLIGRLELCLKEARVPRYVIVKEAKGLRGVDNIAGLLTFDKGSNSSLMDL
jgi:hypothetical protein